MKKREKLTEMPTAKRMKEIVTMAMTKKPRSREVNVSRDELKTRVWSICAAEYDMHTLCAKHASGDFKVEHLMDWAILALKSNGTLKTVSRGVYTLA